PSAVSTISTASEQRMSPMIVAFTPSSHCLPLGKLTRGRQTLRSLSQPWGAAREASASTDGCQPVGSMARVVRSLLSSTSLCFAGAPCCCPSSRAHRIEHQQPWPEVRRSRFRSIQLAAPIPLDVPTNHGAIANPDFHPRGAAFSALRLRAVVLLPT